MKKIIFLLFIVLSISCKSDSDIQSNDNVSLEPKSKGEIIQHTYYTLAYSEENEQAFWVYWTLQLAQSSRTILAQLVLIK